MAAVKSGDYLGVVDFGGSKQFECFAVTFEGSPKIFVGQKVVQDGITGYKIRGKQFVLSTAHSFKQASGIVDADLAALEESSDTSGFLAPASFTLPVGWATVNAGTDDTFIYNKKDSDLDGVEDNPSTTGGGVLDRSAGYVNQIWDYAKANPVTALAIVAAIGYLIHLYMYRNKKRKPKYLGLL